MKKRSSIFVLLFMLLACMTFGLIACNTEDEDSGRVNPRIIVETDQMELAFDILESDYKMPYAGVYYENLDRVDGTEIRISLKDPTGGYIYEDILDYKEIRFLFTGKYELIYKAEGCADVVINIYICERLEMTSEFTLEGNTLTWEESYGASGYEVTVNGEEPIFTSSASFTSDIFAQQGFYVGVTAKGDNQVWVDSYMSSYENRIPLEGGELAAFNNPCYELDIVPATPSTLNAPPEQIEYLTEEECEGSTGGAVRFLMKSGDYGTGLFRLKLQKTVDSNEDFDGMEVRFKLDSKDYIWSAESEPTRLILGQPAADERRVGRGTYVYEGHNDSWQILKIPKSAVNSFDTMNFLQFSLFNMTRSGGKGYLYLDYIRLYKDEVATPTNVAVDGDKLNWDDVENACEYIVSVDKTDDANSYLDRALYRTASSEIAMADIGIDLASATQQYEIQVMAASGDTTIGSSAWSEKVTKRAEVAEKDVTPLDNAIYALDVTNALTYGHIFWKDYEEATGAEGGKAIRMALNAQSSKGYYSCFTVNLTKPLDLENGYDCIILRLKLEATTYESLDTLSVQLVGSDKSNQNYASGTQFRQALVVGEWIEYQMTMADLKTYYETGDTQLSFQITNTVSNKSSSVNMKVALDYLRYYNSIDVPANVRVEGTTLKWDAVDGASGYTVNVNGVAYSGITEMSYDLSTLTGANTMKVLAESASSELASSVYSAEAYYEILADGNLASFNHGGYDAQVVAGNPNLTSSSLNARISSTTFEASYGNGGALDLKLTADKAVSGSKSHIFTVNLKDGLDLTNRKAIQITFLVSSFSKSSSGTVANDVRFMILNAKTQDEGYTKGTVSPYASVVVDSTCTNFQTLSLTVDQLKALGYEDGMTYLTFSVWTNKDTNPGRGGSLHIVMDDISYCQLMATPQNARLDGNAVMWDAVDGARGYEVSLNGEPIVITETSIDLSAYAALGSIRVKVRALPENEAEWTPSDWSKELIKFFPAENELANFNDAAYTTIISTISGKQYSSNTWKESPSYKDGLVSCRIYRDIYGSTNTEKYSYLAAFNITLPKPLDASKGIKVYMYVYDSSYAKRLTACLLKNNDMDNWNADGPTAASVEMTHEQSGLGGWVTLQISAAQLATLGYKTGDTVLSFGLFGSVLANNLTRHMEVKLDYIEYI